MLLPSQLHEISRRYSVYVDEMREFLLHEGFAVNSPGAVAELAARLRQDARFRGDVSSLARAVTYREREQIGYMELLGIVVVAAAGTRGASGQDEAMRQTLRFLMEARRPMHGEGSEAEVEAEPMRSAAVSEPLQMAMPVAESVRPRVVSETSDEPPMAFLADAAGEAPWWRAHAVWVVGFLGVMLGLGAGLMIRRSGNAANSGSTVASTAAPVAVPDAMRSHAQRGRSAGRSRKPSPAIARVSGREASAASHGTGTTGSAGTQGIIGTAREASAGAPLPESSAGRRPQPILAAAQGHVTDRSTLLAEFAHPVGGGTVPRSSAASSVPAATSSPAGSGAFGAPREGVVRLGSAGIMAGNVMFSPPPAYPAAASAAHVQGEVTVRAVVGREGDVIDARVVSGPPLLRDAALEAVERWRYRPYLQDGKPVAVATTAIVDFQMPQ